MSLTYQDPPLTISVLDLSKPIETRLCLESVKRHVKVPHKVVLCDNGSRESYSLDFVREGLVDQLIVNGQSTGLGLGTRDIMNASFSPLTLMLQNDQLFARDLTEGDLNGLASMLGQQTPEGRIASITLAGGATPRNVYGERGHIISTAFYRDMEMKGVLGYHGAGRYHDGPWRESQIQAIYASQGLIHWMPPVAPWVQDNGVYAVRNMGDEGGGVFCHRTDTKACWVIVPPKTRNAAYPKVNDDEFEMMRLNIWPDGKIPETEIAHSFNCWGDTHLARMEVDYIKDLRRRYREERW